VSAGPQSNRPPRFLTDVNFNLRIIVGLRRQQPAVDVLTPLDPALRTLPDPDLLRYAKAQDRILLTHDHQTMPAYFYELLASLPADEFSPGVLIIPQLLPLGAAIDALTLVWSCSTHEEWRDRLERLPL
jgi:uncharacterized protein DUF5615